MAKVQIYSGGSTSPSGISGSIQFNDNGAFGSDATKLFWEDTNNRLGIGTNAPAATLGIQGSGDDIARLMSVDGTKNTFFTNSGYLGIQVYPTATLHIKGVNDSTGSALKVQSATYEVINVYNNRQIVFGGGSAVSNTNYTFSAFSSTSNGNVMVVQNSFGEQIIRVKSDGGTANGGLDIHRASLTGRYALRIIGNTSTSFVIKTSGSMGWQYEATLSELKADQGAAIIGLSGDVGFKGINHYVGSSTYSHVFTGALTRSNGVNLVSLTGSYSEANVSGDTIMLGITPTYNYTGTGSRNVVGLEYNPTLTAITGKNYGLLIKSGLNGFGLGATKPVAYIHIGAGTDSIPQMKLESSVAPTGAALTDGTIWFDGTNLKMRIGGLTKTFTIV